MVLRRAVSVEEGAYFSDTSDGTDSPCFTPPESPVEKTTPSFADNASPAADGHAPSFGSLLGRPGPLEQGQTDRARKIRSINPKFLNNVETMSASKRKPITEPDNGPKTIPYHKLQVVDLQELAAQKIQPGAVLDAFNDLINMSYKFCGDNDAKYHVSLLNRWITEDKLDFFLSAGFNIKDGWARRVRNDHPMAHHVRNHCAVPWKMDGVKDNGPMWNAWCARALIGKSLLVLLIGSRGEANLFSQKASYLLWQLVIDATLRAVHESKRSRWLWTQQRNDFGWVVEWITRRAF